MFTLKFKEGKMTHNVSCQSFSDYTDSWGVIHITVYQGLTTTGGICYQVCSEEVYANLPTKNTLVEPPEVHYFSQCFVENSAGKTINKF